jgi:hypothetical protein
MTDRTPLADLTSDALDTLYDRLDALDATMQSTAAAALAHSGCHSKLMHQCHRAEQAEAAIARALSPEGITAAREALTDEALTRLGRDLGTIHAEDIAAAVVRAALDAAPDPGTVTITQARHDHLVAGQCIHHQDTHRLHHTEPVTGCPYPGCHPDA